MDVQTVAVRQEILRVKRIRELGVELQQVALELAEQGEADMSSRLLAFALKASRLKPRAVEATA